MSGSVLSSMKFAAPSLAVLLLLAGRPAAAGVLDVSYAASGSPSVNVQINYDDTTDVIGSIAPNPSASPSSTLAGTYALLGPNGFAGNDDKVLPANSASNPGPTTLLSRAGVSFTVTQGPTTDETVYSINLSEVPLPTGTYVLEVSSLTMVTSGLSTTFQAPVFATQDLTAPGAAPGFGLAGLAALSVAGLCFGRATAGR